MLISFAAGAGPSNLTTPVTAAGAEVSAKALGLVGAAGAAAPGTALSTSARIERAKITTIISWCFRFMVFRPPYSFSPAREGFSDSGHESQLS